MEIYDASALSLHKKQSSTYQKRHGCRWFQAAASFSSEKLLVVQRTRTYAVQHACGCFLYAPSICIVYFQKAFFYNIQHIYFVALAKAYILVHFLAASFGSAETSLLFTTSGIRASSEYPHCIKISINGCKNINSG